VHDHIKLLAEGDVNIVLDQRLSFYLVSHESEVTEIWNSVVEKNDGQLYNAPLCFFSGVEPCGNKWVMRVFFGEYRHFVAQRNGLELGLTPLGVSGVVLCKVEDEYCAVIGTRSESVTLYPRALEFVPSGGVDDTALISKERVDPQCVLTKELEEELGVPQDAIQKIVPIAVVDDCVGGVVDLCYAIFLGDIHLLKKKWCAENNDEYEAFECVPLRNLQSWLRSTPPGSVVPTTMVLAKMLKRVLALASLE